MTRIAGRSTARVSTRRSSATSGLGKPTVADLHPRASLEVASWRVGRRGLLALSVSVSREAAAPGLLDVTASVELRRDHRGPTDGDLVLVAHRASQSLSAATGAREFTLLLSDWRADGDLLALPEALRRVQEPEVACVLIARGDGSTLLLTDLPARLGLRGGTYVQTTVVSVEAVERALGSP